MSQTVWLKHRNYFVTVMEAKNSKYPTELVSGEVSLPDLLLTRCYKPAKADRPLASLPLLINTLILD